MYKHVISNRSKLKNFAPKILLCAQLIVLSIRNANIVFGTAEELEKNPLYELFKIARTIRTKAALYKNKRGFNAGNSYCIKAPFI
ncbi:MAG: hypothetical protein EGQ52_00660 [Prevotella sp.]|nr:hypothetical protein [Prevotella sp.]